MRRPDTESRIATDHLWPFHVSEPTPACHPSVRVRIL